MRMNLKKVLAGAAGVAMTATLAPALTATMAGAAGVSSGTPTLSPTSGNSTTDFVLSLPSGAACNEDSAAGGWTVTSFMVPTTTDLSTLAFDPSGPSPASTGTYSTFKQPLWQPGGNAFVSRSTVNATPPDPSGPILNPNTFDFDPGYNAGDIPAGAYNIGIACVDETFAIQQYWATTVTVTANPADPGTADINWSLGAVPSAPTITGVTPGDGTLSVAFTAPAAVPPVGTYTVTATPQGGGASVTQTGSGSPILVSGLTNGVTYDLSLTATNTAGTSAAATSTGTPTPAPRAPVTGFTATPATGQVDLSWTTPSGVAPTGYSLVITPTSPAGAALPTVTLPAGTTSYTATGLTAGTTYSFVLTPLHPAPYTAPAATASATPLAAQVLLQDITVTRPVGALVLTQVCGAYGPLASEGAQLGFPGGLPAAPAVNSSTVASPNLATAGIPTGENTTSYSQYPYPTNPDGTANATYPTRCGINLGNAQFVRSGAGAGQFFAADGRLNQVTVVDTRDADTGWNVVGQVSDFTAGPGKSFSGSQLGWVPVKTEDTGSFVDSLGNSYDQVASAGGAIAPNTLVASGLSSNRTLVTANGAVTSAPGVTTGGLGTAIADARLKLLIPITAQAGTYTAVLTISTL